MKYIHGQNAHCFYSKEGKRDGGEMPLLRAIVSTAAYISN